MRMDLKNVNHRGKKRQIEFERLTPVVLFLYYMLLIITTMVFNAPIFLGMEFLIIIALAIMTAGYDKAIQTLKVSLGMMLFIIIINPITNHNGSHILLSFNGFIITEEAMIYGVLMAFSLLNVILIFISYNQVLSNNKFMYIFGRILPQLTLLTMIVMRFVPLFLKRFKNISEIQKTRGIEVESGTVKEKSLNLMHLLEVLLVDSCYEAFQTADSMAARGFGSTQRTNYEQYKFTNRDNAVLGILAVGVVLISYAKFNNLGNVIIYPTLVIPSMMSSSGILVLFLLGVVCSLPILFELWEALWWKFSK